jgi:hypothetical protein
MFIMETMERKQPRCRRSSMPEFKAEIVRETGGCHQARGARAAATAAAGAGFWVPHLWYRPLCST